jgi:ABC-2 type transport system permease protein
MASYYLRSVRSHATRVLRENIRVFPWTFFASRLLTAFFTILFAFFISTRLFEGVPFDNGAVQDYLLYILVGVGIQTYANAALLGVGRSLIIERRIGTLEALYLTPASQITYLLGVLIEQALLATIDFIIIVSVGIIFGARLNQANFLSFLVILVVGHIGFFGMSILLAAIMLRLRETYITQNTAITLLYLICGALFPIHYLPDWVQKISSLIPLTATIALARGALLEGLSIQEQFGTFAILCILSIIFCIVGIYQIERIRRIALETNLS